MSSFKLLLGYEKVDNYNQVIDILVRKTGEGYELIQPKDAIKEVSEQSVEFQGDEYYRKDLQVKKGNVKKYMMNSDGREYMVTKLSNMRDDVIFRMFHIEDASKTGDFYILRVHQKDVVEEVIKDTENPKVFYNDEGNMELEEHYNEQIRRELSINTATSLRTETRSQEVSEDKENILTEDMIGKIIKEVGDSEISLAVINNPIK